MQNFGIVIVRIVFLTLQINIYIQIGLYTFSTAHITLAS